MLEIIHRISSRIRHSRFLKNQRWLWEKVEPFWEKVFEWFSNRHGYSTHINEDVFKLLYIFGSRYDRFDQRVYEPSFYQPFVQRIREGMTVFDIGAHIGLFTLGAAKRVGKEGQVYAFEPSPETVKILERHISLNGWQDRIELVTAVVSDVNGIVPFYTYGLSMAASLGRENVEVLNPEYLDTPARKIDVTAITLDQFCMDRDIFPDILKIDVEGAELMVLRGAKNLLLNNQITILCEIHPKQMKNCGSSLQELTEYLDSFGYCLKPLDKPNELGTFHSIITPREWRRNKI
ncbi:MAG: FkbM family methyltransferase [Planctomycetes bacterium]|nr:FkbM family methyltransferase [Planctomycetota bacterium]